MTIERQMQNGEWTEESAERAQYFLDMAATCNQKLHGKWQKITTQDAKDVLAAGNTLRYDTDWYAKLRNKEVFAARLKDARDAKRTEENVMCDCGHSVPKVLVMRASLGTSCPDCYDRMSD